MEVALSPAHIIESTTLFPLVPITCVAHTTFPLAVTSFLGTRHCPCTCLLQCSLFILPPNLGATLSLSLKSHSCTRRPARMRETLSSHPSLATVRSLIQNRSGPNVLPGSTYTPFSLTKNATLCSPSIQPCNGPMTYHRYRFFLQASSAACSSLIDLASIVGRYHSRKRDAHFVCIIIPRVEDNARADKRQG